MLICIAGKNNIAVNVLEYIIAEKQKYDYDIVCVLNKNDNRINSWQKSLGWYCKKNNIRICTIDELYEKQDLVFLSLEFDQIIRPHKFISDKLYNIHFSLLPEYKGMYTSVLPILHNKKETGVTFHRIRQGIDTGEIIAQKKIKIECEDTSLDVYNKCISVGSDLVIESLNRILEGENINMHMQPIEGSTYYSKSAIDYDNLELDVNCTGFQIYNQVRAFNFRPYQLISWNDFNIVDCEVSSNLSTEKPGTILEQTGDSITISTIDYDTILYIDHFHDLLLAIKEKNNDYAKHLIKIKKIINEKNDYGWSPLIVATYNNNKEMVNLLLDCGADIYVKNNNGTNLLMYAKDCYANTGDPYLFELFVEKGLDIQEEDYLNRNLIYYCNKQGIKKIGKYNIC